MKLANNLQRVWNHAGEFVRAVCAGRDKSHGYEHMQAVAHNAIGIAADIFGPCTNSNEHQLKLIILAAWLHDVADHKYDHEGLLHQKVVDFLAAAAPEDAALIMNIIDRISYSKEVKARAEGALDWENVLGTEGMLLRDIVSDADKLEALGVQGLERCKEYGRHSYFEKHGIAISSQLLKQQVKDHADEKLIRLKDHFIRTVPGKKRAEALHEEFVQALEAL